MPIATVFRNLCFSLFLLGVGAGQTAFADQTDPRLNDLFEHLKDVTEPSDIISTERQIWRIWLEAADDKTQALLDHGIEQMNSGQHKGALEAFDTLIAQAPDFAEAWNKRATLFYILGNYERSLEDIAKTLELEPRHFGALSGRGLVYANQDDLENALLAFEAALRVNPTMGGARVNADAIRKILKEREI